MSRDSDLKWTNASVLLYAKEENPIEKIERDARQIVLSALENGWEGPPFDPIKLAQLNKIEVSPNSNIRDAHTISRGAQKFIIEFNPNRSRGRIRFSIAHEIAHTLFPDCANEVRERHRPGGGNDQWQLEMLCNIAASEIVMPIGSIRAFDDDEVSFEQLLSQRKKLDVSAEAILIRYAKMADQPVAMFCASRPPGGHTRQRHLIDYSIRSANWPYGNFGGLKLESRCLDECTAIGYIVSGLEVWAEIKLHVSCIGLPPYPGTTAPRIAGILTIPGKHSIKERKIKYHEGDATNPGGTGRKLIAHIVNDRTPNWGGGGFAVSLKKRFPEVPKEFRDWVLSDREQLRLGQSHITHVAPNLQVCSMIAQRGYGHSHLPRIRYVELEKCLQTLASHAMSANASVHMPRIGTGNAGGNWAVIEEMLKRELVDNGISVNVYNYA